MTRRFPPPWTVETIPGGFKVLDATGQALAYVYSREKEADSRTAKVLTTDAARRIAANIALGVRWADVCEADQSGSLRGNRRAQGIAVLRRSIPRRACSGTVC